MYCIGQNKHYREKQTIYNTFYLLLKDIGTYLLLHLHWRPKWRKSNMHNLTELKTIIPMNLFGKIIVGNYTYGELDCMLFDLKDSYIKIGSYCSIASGVQFLCGMDHAINHLSTYPVGVRSFEKGEMKEIECSLGSMQTFGTILALENTNKGPIIIGDDVRIGIGVKIMSGVTIGQGAVIAAGAVVTKNVPPYAVVGGVPARVIKYRFSQNIIDKLLQINFGEIPIEFFRRIYVEIVKEDFDVDYILALLNKK